MLFWFWKWCWRPILISGLGLGVVGGGGGMVESCDKERWGGLLFVNDELVGVCEKCGKEEGRVSVVVGLVGGGS